MTTDRPRQPALSGWCLTRDHDRCAWSGCHCDCGHEKGGDDDRA